MRIYTTAVTTGDTQGNLHLITINDGFVYHPRVVEKISLNLIINLQKRILTENLDIDGNLFVPVLVRFVVITLLNLWVLLTVIYYQRRSRKSKKDD